MEGGERLVEQKDLGVTDDSASHGDTLPVVARKLTWIALQIGDEAEDLGGPAHTLGDGRFVGASELQREAHVVGDRHMRIERVVLEHHGNVALLWRNAVHHQVTDADLACRDALEDRKSTSLNYSH